MSAPISIRARLLRDIVAIILLLGVSVYLVSSWAQRETVQSLSDSALRRVGDETQLRLERFFAPVERHLRMVESWHAQGLTDFADLERADRLLIPVMQAYPQVTAMMIADGRGREYMLLRSGSYWTRRMVVQADSQASARISEWSEFDRERRSRSEELHYDPRSRPWFEGALRASREASEASAGGPSPVYWTRPYLFFTTRDPGVTASIALRGSDGVDYVLGFDVTLDDVTEYTSSRELRVSKNSRVFVIDEESGALLGLPYDVRYPTKALRKAAVLTPIDDLDIAMVRDGMAAYFSTRPGEAPFRFESEGRRWWGGVRAHRLSPERTLLLGVVVPESDLLGGLAAVQIWIPLATLLAIAIAIWRGVAASRLVSRPIEALVQESERIRMGDLDEPAQIPSRLVEVRQLADAQDRMRSGLKSLVRLEGDLQVARQIQQKTFPQALPSLSGFELDGWSEPADATGGDTYDVIGLQTESRSASIALTEGSADRAVLMLADATGHGIGPALSVTQLRAMLRMLVRTGQSLESIAEHANAQLCADLPGSRFITAWFGVLDVQAGSLVSWSAGQGPLIHYREARDEFDVRLPDAPPIGILEPIQVEIAEPLLLATGDVYAVFSDGIFEAANPEGQRFGEAAVQAVIREHRSESATAIAAAVRSAVTAFANGRPADDDRTGIVIKRV